MVDRSLLHLVLDLLYGAARLAAAVEGKNRQHRFARNEPGPISTLDGLCSLLEALTKARRDEIEPSVEKMILPRLLEEVELRAHRLIPLLAHELRCVGPEVAITLPALVDVLRATPWEVQLEQLMPAHGAWRQARMLLLSVLSPMVEKDQAEEPVGSFALAWICEA